MGVTNRWFVTFRGGVTIQCLQYTYIQQWNIKKTLNDVSPHIRAILKKLLKQDNLARDHNVRM